MRRYVPELAMLSNGFEPEARKANDHFTLALNCSCGTTGMPEPLVNGHQTAIPSDFMEARRILEEIERLLAVEDYDARDRNAIRLALDEALVNAVKHGNKMDRNKRVRIAYQVTDARFEVTIQDEGAGFNPDEVPDPLALENLERPSGRGLLLMRHYMSDVVFQPPGNKVTMRKLRSQLTRNGPA